MCCEIRIFVLDCLVCVSDRFLILLVKVLLISRLECGLDWWRRL